MGAKKRRIEFLAERDSRVHRSTRIICMYRVRHCTPCGNISGRRIRDRPAKSGGKARAATRRTDRLSCSPISEGPRRSVTEYTPDTERRTFCIVVHIHDTWADITHV
ncbi:uncharacterized protein LOC105686611 isoform X2 [Athalia rosae]|uniref:uncharacterized protein LOC105686611 isoform X2 n=1 Tax=Athalia rosae TaxID=37344 RepID=UPI0020345675|nr:uncharacterized protein LOC105686611 isoform X2 [Athalia rosae]